jgi:hypothetical protein
VDDDVSEREDVENQSSVSRTKKKVTKDGNEQRKDGPLVRLMDFIIESNAAAD